MKRIYTIISLTVLFILAVSCVDKPINGPDQTGYLTVGTYSDTDYTLAKGKSKSVLLTANAAEDAVCSDFVKITFKIDPSLVETYNVGKDTSCVLLPSSAYQFISNEVMMAKYNRNSSTAELKIICNDLEDDVKYVLPVTIGQITGSDKCFVADNAPLYITVKKDTAAQDSGDGSIDNPYIISTTAGFMLIPELVQSGTTTYFKLGADIDLDGEDWVPFNQDGPYDKAINMDGQGHVVYNLTCKSAYYPSFMGVVVGEIHDISFENALIEGGTSASGILGGYVGTILNNVPLRANVYNVHVSGTVNATAANGVGGIAGRCGYCVIDRCSANVILNASKLNYVGGIVGYDPNKDVVISNCWSSGSLQAAQRCGGIVGGLIQKGSTIRNCYSTMSVESPFNSAGIAGHCCLAKQAANTEHPENVIEGCIAWNNLVSTSGTESNAYFSAGAIVGYTAIYNTLRNCWRKADKSAFVWGASLNVLKDHEDASESSPMPIICNPPSENVFPYHGKAAGETETCSDVARRIGWSESIWDLSEELPKLK